jgi:hypothetical protein
MGGDIAVSIQTVLRTSSTNAMAGVLSWPYKDAT